MNVRDESVARRRRSSAAVSEVEAARAQPQLHVAETKRAGSVGAGREFARAAEEEKGHLDHVREAIMLGVVDGGSDAVGVV